MKQLISFLLFFIFSTCSLLAHSGRTDKYGGHNDRQRGGYHYHHGEKAHAHPDGVCELSSSGYLALGGVFVTGIVFFGRSGRQE